MMSLCLTEKNSFQYSWTKKKEVVVKIEIKTECFSFAYIYPIFTLICLMFEAGLMCVVVLMSMLQARAVLP